MIFKAILVFVFLFAVVGALAFYLPKNPTQAK